MITSFSLGIFTMYFLFGLGMQRLLQGETFESGFRYILVVFLVVLGLAHVEDWRRLRAGKNSLFRTDWTLKYVKAGVTSGKHSSYFLIGALFSLVKAPCVGAIYLAILDLLSAKSYLKGCSLPVLLQPGGYTAHHNPGRIHRPGDESRAGGSFRKDHRVGMRLVRAWPLALAPLIYWQLI